MHQVNLNLSLILVDVKLVLSRYWLHTYYFAASIFCFRRYPRFAEKRIKLDRMVDRVKPWFLVNGLAHG